MITFGHGFGIHNQIGTNLGELVAIYLFLHYIYLYIFWAPILCRILEKSRIRD